MLVYNDTNVTTSLQQNYFTEEYIINGRKGDFQVAFGFVSYDSSLDGFDYSAYGELKARLVQWEPVNGTEFFIIDTHPCSEEELGLTEDREASQFYLALDSDYK